MAELNYTADHEKTEQTFDVIPPGEYISAITESDICETKAGNGRYLKLKYQIIDGENKGRILFENLNIDNPNKQAEAIAQRSLNAICAACGIVDLKDSSELHDIPMKIDVKIKNSVEYGPQNVIKKHEAVGQPVPKANKNSQKNPWE